MSLSISSWAEVHVPPCSRDAVNGSAPATASTNARRSRKKVRPASTVLLATRTRTPSPSGLAAASTAASPSAGAAASRSWSARAWCATAGPSATTVATSSMPASRSPMGGPSPGTRRSASASTPPVDRDVDARAILVERPALAPGGAARDEGVEPEEARARRELEPLLLAEPRAREAAHRLREDGEHGAVIDARDEPLRACAAPVDLRPRLRREERDRARPDVDVERHVVARDEPPPWLAEMIQAQRPRGEGERS